MFYTNGMISIIDIIIKTIKKWIEKRNSLLAVTLRPQTNTFFGAWDPQKKCVIGSVIFTHGWDNNGVVLEVPIGTVSTGCIGAWCEQMGTTTTVLAWSQNAMGKW